MNLPLEPETVLRRIRRMEYDGEKSIREVVQSLLDTDLATVPVLELIRIAQDLELHCNAERIALIEILRKVALCPDLYEHDLSGFADLLVRLKRRELVGLLAGLHDHNEIVIPLITRELAKRTPQSE